MEFLFYFFNDVQNISEETGKVQDWCAKLCTLEWENELGLNTEQTIYKLHLTNLFQFMSD